MKRKIFIVCILGALVLAGGSFALAAEKVLKVGVLEPMSGSLAHLGKLDKMGFEYVIDKINSSGGIKSMGGAKLEIVWGDSEGKPEVGISATERLIRQGVVAIMGSYQSSVVFAATNISERAKVPFIISSGSAPDILERGFKYTFRVMTPSDWMARDQLKAIIYLGEKSGKMIQKAGILYEDTLFGQSSRDGVKKWAGEYKIPVVADIGYSHSQSDFTTEITKLKASKPDITFMSPYLADAILIRKTMFEMGFDSMAGIIGSSGLYHPEYRSSLGKIADFTFTLDFYNEDASVPGVKEFHSDFIKKYGQPISGAAALCHLAATVLVDALERSGSTDSEKLRKAIADTDLKVGERGNISPYGVKFDGIGQNIKATLLVEQIQNGKLVPFWPPDMTQGTAVYPIPKWSEFAK
jgi:branched-chain amino acid transport system substrate-binding protein